MIIGLVFMFIIIIVPAGGAILLSYLAERKYTVMCEKRYKAVRYTPCPPVSPRNIPRTNSVSIPVPTEISGPPEPVQQEEPVKSEPEPEPAMTLTKWVEINSDMLLQLLSTTGKHELLSEILNGMDEEVESWLLEQEQVSIVQQSQNGIEFVVEERRD